MRKLEVKIRYFFWAIKVSFKPNNGYYAIYKNKQYVLKNEIYDERVWTLIDYKNNVKIHSVNVKDFKLKIPSLKWFITTFKQHMIFQMTSWYSIDYRKPLFARISYKNSNNINF